MDTRREETIKGIERFATGALLSSISLCFFLLTTISYLLLGQHLVWFHELSGLGLLIGTGLLYREKHWIFKDPLANLQDQVNEFSNRD
jgi:hypothetical protein